MEKTEILRLENDGLNMAVEGQSLYIRCKRAMVRYDLTDMSQTAHNVVFKKDGKSRGFAICDKLILLYDFCDLFILNKLDLQVECVVRLGEDLSSDVCGVMFDSGKAYVSVRNGGIVVIDLLTMDAHKYDLCDTSFWDCCATRNRIYVGSVRGELLEIDKNDMRILRKLELSKKNIYSVVADGGLLHTVSQDKTIKAVDIASFETVCVAKKAVGGMARIIGIEDDFLAIADSGQISLWDKHTLQMRMKFSFPTGSYNKGVTLSENRLFGSDDQGVYRAVIG